LFARFTQFLDHPLTAADVWHVLPPTTATMTTLWVYGCDGKWLGRVGVFFIHRNVTTKENIWWSFMKSESYDAVAHDVSMLTDSLGVRLPQGAVSDWKGAIVSAVASYFGPIPHQRCLAHVEREAKRLLPERSPFEATQALRRIASLLFLVEKSSDVMVWQAYFPRWEKRYGSMLKEKTIAPTAHTRSWWYTHGNLRRAWRLLTHDTRPFFVFLTSPLIPKTNNALEGVNSNLKQKLGNHRGMSTDRQAAFLSWYMAFTRSTSEKDLKKLWAYWKMKFSRA
jgi:transposase-like protein